MKHIIICIALFGCLQAVAQQVAPTGGYHYECEIGNVYPTDTLSVVENGTRHYVPICINNSGDPDLLSGMDVVFSMDDSILLLLVPDTIIDHSFKLTVALPLYIKQGYHKLKLQYLYCSDYHYLRVKDPVEVDENTVLPDSSVASFNLYPCPASNTLTISYADTGHHAQLLSIHDISGKACALPTVISEAKQLQIPLSGFQNGKYIVTLLTDAGIVQRQMVVEK